MIAVAGGAFFIVFGAWSNRWSQAHRNGRCLLAVVAYFPFQALTRSRQPGSGQGAETANKDRACQPLMMLVPVQLVYQVHQILLLPNKRQAASVN